jgi:hypothetical protein
MRHCEYQSPVIVSKVDAEANTPDWKHSMGAGKLRSKFKSVVPKGHGSYRRKMKTVAQWHNASVLLLESGARVTEHSLFRSSSWRMILAAP